MPVPEPVRTVELEFYGAAGRVTGSCHVLRLGSSTVLLDCGLIQGGREEEGGNADPFPFDAAEVDAVVLSHAHLDHAGRLPLLVKRGFRGTIHAQNATRALMRILLTDAANLEQSRIRRRNRRELEAGEPLSQALYGLDEVTQTLALTRSHGYGEAFDVVPGLKGCFHDAGHIMGSAVVEVILDGAPGKRLVFSGDLGQYGSPILRDPVTPPQADVVLMECTYGDRRHRPRPESLAEFGEVLDRAYRAGGNVLIPAFAVGRSQELLYQLAEHFDEWRVDRFKVFLDSPLAIEASQIYWDFSHLYDREARQSFLEHQVRRSLPNLFFTHTADESRAIARLERGALVIAGSGMCNGGRILHHLKREVGRKASHVVFTGYQPPGTLGRRIIDGAETVRIHGEPYPVRAGVHTIGGFSAHGDRDDLLRWYRGFEVGPGAGPVPVYLVHGDPDVADLFAATLREEGIPVHVAAPGMQVEL